MGRQPLILALALLFACDEEYGDLPWFDGPSGAAVLDPADGGPFDEPVGFVANSRGGTIVPIDVKHVTLLADQPGSPFLAPRQIATGDERRLDQIAVYATEAEDVTLYAADLAFGVLVEAPYLRGAEPFPERVEATSTEASFLDLDGSGDSPTLTDIELRNGYTTTEDWTVEYDGARWWAKGSRSGQQSAEPVAGEAYCSDRRELCFTLSGTATEGDRFELSTDAGIVEHDLGGLILGLARVPGQDLLVAAVWDDESAAGSIVFFDLAAGQESGRIALGEGAQPARFSFGEGVIYVTDAQLPQLYTLTLDAADPSASALQTLDLPTPASAVAWVQTSSGPRLAVGLTELYRVDLYDLTTASWVDANVFDDEVAGISMHSSIVGLAATPEPIRLQQETAWGADIEAPTVAITTSEGTLTMMDAESGCLATEEEGPTLASSSSGETVSFADVGQSSSPAFLVDDSTGWGVVVNPCGGVARDESWVIRYDQAVGAWEVEGTRSDIQEAMAWEETRYVSDRAEVSFTILNGQLPPTSGDSFAFTVDDGVLTIDELISSDGSSTPLAAPAAPVIFQTENGPTGGGWDPLDRQTYVLLPVTNLNLVMRTRLSSWDVEVVWR